MENAQPRNGFDDVTRTLIVGVGNCERRDDGLGIAVVRHLRTCRYDDLACRESDSDPGALMETWEGYESVIVVDAVVSSRSPGTIVRFDAASEPLPEETFPCYSTHGFGLARAIELARVLKRLPRRLIVYGMEGEDFGVGRGLSPIVEQRITILAYDIARAASYVASRHKPQIGTVRPGDRGTTRALMLSVSCIRCRALG